MADISDEVKESLSLVEDLKFFLATAPANWQENQVIRRYYLNNDEGFVSCVFWNNLYFITGTDIVRCILYKFQHFGRTVTDRKKFEEGIFSDLRNLKAGTDSVLENPKSEFLEFLYKNSCLRTQKKQKVFFWFNVPHDKLMADALERDIKKEKAHQPATSVASREPALSFNYVEDKTKTLYEQLSEHLAQSKFEPAKADEGSGSGSGSPQHAPGFSAISSDTPFDTHALGSASVGTKPSISGHQASATFPSAVPETNLAHTSHGLARNGNDDDDFPLDYLDHQFAEAEAALLGPEWAGRDYVGRDYITLDSHHHTGTFINAFDSDFDNLDTSAFQATQNSVNVVSNDDYLIEQTVPTRPGPLNPYNPLNSASQYFNPRSAKFYDDAAYFPQPTGFGPQFPLSSLATSFAPYGHDYAYNSHEVAPVYPHIPFENEYLHPQLTPVVAGHPMGHLDAGGPGFGYVEDMDYLMRSNIPSQRQQSASTTMMRKMRQFHHNHNGDMSKVTKPGRTQGHRGPEYEAKLRAQVKKEDDMSAAIPSPESSIKMAAFGGNGHGNDERTKNM